MRLLISTLVAMSAVALSACGGNEGGGGGDAGTPAKDAGTNPNACTGSEPQVTAEQVFTDVISSTGACASCHFTNAPATTGGGVVMDSTATLKANVGQTTKGPYAQTLKIVDPNHPENSTLFLKTAGGSNKGITGPHGEDVGPLMPSGGPQLPAQKIEEIKNWICSGAQ